MPPEGARCLLRLAGLRAKLAVRGTRFRPRPAREIAPSVLERIDACSSLARGLALHDVLRAQVFQSRGTLLALQAGDPSRCARALALEYVNACLEAPGKRERHATLLERAAELADQVGEGHARALIPFARGFASYVAYCEWDRTVQDLAEAEELLRSECVDVAWELHNSRFFSIESLRWRGGWRRLGHEASRFWRETEERGSRYLVAVIRGQLMVFAALVDGDVEAALDHWENAYREVGELSPLFLFNRARYRALIELYRGDGPAARRWVDDFRGGLLGHLLLRAPIMRFVHAQLRVRTALGAAARSEDLRADLAAIRELGRRLTGSPIPCEVPLGSLALAGAADLEGDPETTLARLREAERGFAERGMEGYVAACRSRRGRIIGGDEGQALLVEAADWMHTQGVRDPAAMTAFLLPGATS